jgi:hypothetical protein
VGPLCLVEHERGAWICMIRNLEKLGLPKSSAGSMRVSWARKRAPGEWRLLAREGRASDEKNRSDEYLGPR